MKLANVAIVFVLVVALLPAAFWLTYGTMDACTAFRQAMTNEAAQKNGGLASVVTGLVVYGAVGVGRLNGTVCLEALWKLETEGPDAAMKVVENELR